jgi:Dynamin family
MKTAMTGMPPRSGANGASDTLHRIAAAPGSGVAVPRLVLAGEANSGKTTLVNFLLQAQLLVADIVPNTPCPTLLRFGETAYLRVHHLDGHSAIRSLADLHRLGREQVRLIEVYLPSAVLRRMEILDLPGFASRADAEAKSNWLASADIRIWCTPATQAWKASEKEIWLSLGKPRASSFLVLTHRDLLSETQLGDVSERMSRETQRFFSHWTSIATPEAIAARNPRGEIVKREAWTSTGVEDFMKKLMDLLQGVMAPRREPPPSSPPPPAPLPAPRPAAEPRPGAAAAASADASHPVSSFAQMRQRLLKALSAQNSAEQAAAMLAGELNGYANKVLTPWISAKGSAALKAANIEALIPRSDAEIVAYLLPQPADPAPFTAGKILKQIEAELAEALTAF